MLLVIPVASVPMVLPLATTPITSALRGGSSSAFDLIVRGGRTACLEWIEWYYIKQLYFV